MYINWIHYVCNQAYIHFSNKHFKREIRLLRSAQRDRARRRALLIPAGQSGLLMMCLLDTYTFLRYHLLSIFAQRWARWERSMSMPLLQFTVRIPRTRAHKSNQHAIYIISQYLSVVDKLCMSVCVFVRICCYYTLISFASGCSMPGFFRVKYGWNVWPLRCHSIFARWWIGVADVAI